jgi:hypothetical protein
MAKDERTQPIAGSDAPEASPAGDTDDTEGNSMGLLLGMNAMSRTSKADERSRSKQPADQELPPLSKKWPSMRDEKKA